MNNVFEKDKKYTVFSISSFMANTCRAEIVVVELKEGLPIFKFRGKRKLKRFMEMKELAVFEGWDIPLRSDADNYGSNGSIMRCNACFNFIGEAGFVREYIDKHQLNPEFPKDKVLAVSGIETDKEEVVYPELAENSHHAVIDRIMANQGKEESHE